MDDFSVGLSVECDVPLAVGMSPVLTIATTLIRRRPSDVKANRNSGSTNGPNQTGDRLSPVI